MKFEYSIPDNIEIEEEGGKFLCISREPTAKEVVVFRKSKNGEQMILANKEGWEYLAKVCIEMSFIADRDPAFHSHRTENFDFSDNSTEDKIGFFNISDSLEREVLEKRKKFS